MLAFVTLVFSLLFLSVRATDYYTVEWNGVTFTAMSGDMVVPQLPQAGGTPYVWPGFQSDNGVLQAVLDGRSGFWWIASGFYGTPSSPWGNGFYVNPGDTVHFSFSSSGTVWTCTLSSNGNSATTTLDVGGNTMNRAIFAAKLTNVPFNFGPITYSNVEITSTTDASYWCGEPAYLGTYPFSATGMTASGNVCNIATIVQNSAV